MLALLNILLLMAPISQNSHEFGVGYNLGYNYESVQSNNIVFDDYFYNGSAEGIGNLNGINLYYNYYLSNQLFIGIESNYLQLNSNLIKTESELINIDGKKVEGEFEHVFDYNTDNLLSVLNIGYNITSNLYLKLGLTYNTSISDYNISTFERISKPKDAGVFIVEQSRIRDEKDTILSKSISSFGLLPSLNIKLPMNSNNTLFLNGSAKYNYSLNNIIDNDLIWNTNNLLFNIGISYVIGNKYDSRTENETPIESNIIAFELIDNVEQSATNFHFDVISFQHLKDGKTVYANFSDLQSIVFYIQLNNYNSEIVEFKLLSDTFNIVNKFLKDNLTKISIPKTVINTNTKPSILTVSISSEGNTIENKTFNTVYNILFESKYLFTSELSELKAIINSNSDKVISIYSNDEKIYNFLGSLQVSNITVRTMEELDFNLENYNKDKYLLIIE